MLRPTYNDLIDSMNKNREEGELEVQLPVQSGQDKSLTEMRLL